MTASSVPPFLPSAAYHEAGHAFAYWYLGIELHSVQVQPNTKDAVNLLLTLKDGIQEKALGVCEPKIDLFAPRRLSGEAYYEGLKAAFVKQVFVSLAGPINSERDGGLPLDIELKSGSGDARKIEMCCRYGRISLLHQTKIIKISKRLLRSERAERVMRIIAARLAQQGYLRGHRIATICDSVFGDHPRPFDTSR